MDRKESYPTRWGQRLSGDASRRLHSLWQSIDPTYRELATIWHCEGQRLIRSEAQVRFDFPFDDFLNLLTKSASNTPVRFQTAVPREHMELAPAGEASYTVTDRSVNPDEQDVGSYIARISTRSQQNKPVVEPDIWVATTISTRELRRSFASRSRPWPPRWRTT